MAEHLNKRKNKLINLSNPSNECSECNRYLRNEISVPTGAEYPFSRISPYKLIHGSGIIPDMLSICNYCV